MCNRTTTQTTITEAQQQTIQTIILSWKNQGATIHDIHKQQSIRERNTSKEANYDNNYQ